MPFVGALRLVFSEYLDKSLSSDENFIFALVEVLGGTINCNVSLLQSDKPLAQECKNGVLLLALLYLHNNLNYTQNSNLSAELHLGQLIETIEWRGEVLKSNRYYRPLFLRTLVQRNSSAYSNNRGGFRERFDVKRPRLVSPTPKPEYQFQRSLQNSPVFQLHGSLGNPVQGRSSPLLSS